MYFDHCQEPADLKRAITDFMKIQTGRRISVAGVGKEGLTIPSVDEHTDQTLRQGYAEALAAARRMQKAQPLYPEIPAVSVVPLEGLSLIGGWCEKADWRGRLQQTEEDFLSAIGRKVELLVAGPENNGAMERFRSQLASFGEKWQTYRVARDAYENGTWHGEMGEPTNPLGAIWPYTYGTGWQQPEDFKPPGSGIWLAFDFLKHVIEKDVPKLLGDYALLAVIHDGVLPKCARISDVCLPDDLAREIWEDLLDDADGEGSGLLGPRHAINRRQVEAALASVTQDIEPERNVPVGSGAGIATGIGAASGAGQAGRRPDPIATANAIITGLESLRRRPPEHTELKQDEQHGTFNTVIGGTAVRFFGRDGLLWNMQSREPAGRVLQARDIAEATTGIEYLLQYLRRNGFKEAGESVQKAWDDIREGGVTVLYLETRPGRNPLVRLQQTLEVAIGDLSKAQTIRRLGDAMPDGHAGVRSPASSEIDETEIRQIKEYAARVAGLLEPMEIPSIEPTWESEPPGLDHTNRIAHRVASEQAKALHPLKVEYRKRVVAILENGWEPIADIFEHYAPQTLGRLGGWRQDILDHTDPAKDHTYWLECRDGKFGPNPDLKNRLENVAGKLRREVERAERALNSERANVHQPEQRLTKPDIPVLVEKLKTLRFALDSGEKESISRARNDLRQYVDSAERLYDALQEPLRGSTADAIERLKLVGYAMKSRMNTGLYAALLDGLATSGFIAELERWQKTQSPPTENVFRRVGDRWAIRFRDGEERYMDTLDGMAYIHHLLGQPDRDVPAIDVYAVLYPPERACHEPAEPHSENEGDADAREGDPVESIADEDLLAAYKEGLEEIQDEVEQAKRNGDIAAQERAEKKMADIRAQVSKAMRPTKHGTVSRNFTAEPNRKKDNVRQAITRALGRLATVDPELSRYLRKTISTGWQCKYAPDTPIDWSL